MIELSGTLQHLRDLIDQAAHLLPAQGPIPVFIHHNTLHAFEGLPFEQAVVQGGQIFGCRPFLSEHRYREELARGRIRFEDLEAILIEDLGNRADELVPPRGSRLDLRRAMLQFSLRSGTTKELLWLVAETDALRRVRADMPANDRAYYLQRTREWVLHEARAAPGELADVFARSGSAWAEAWDDDALEAFTLQALWRICRRGVVNAANVMITSPRPARHRDLLLEATGHDSNLLVHDLLIRFCSVFLDQGLARWLLPGRDVGFLASFSALYRQPGASPYR